MKRLVPHTGCTDGLYANGKLIRKAKGNSSAHPSPEALTVRARYSGLVRRKLKKSSIVSAHSSCADGASSFEGLVADVPAMSMEQPMLAGSVV